MTASVIVPRRFNGPLENGNGGYSAGLAAGFLEGPVEVTLRSPVPLDTPLRPIAEDGAVRLLAGDETILEARRAPGFEIEVPGPVSAAQAREAMARYPGEETGPFSRCFVCGVAREDTLGVFSGRVDGRDIVASAWTPPQWTADGDGQVRPEFVWSVLDCPTFFGAYMDIDVEELPLSFLGRLTARIEALPAIGEEHVLMSWPLGIDGRKAESGVALLTAGGEVLAAARAVLIEPRKGE
jgi:hypothetical protein